jgi:hypothetical protein
MDLTFFAFLFRFLAILACDPFSPSEARLPQRHAEGGDLPYLNVEYRHDRSPVAQLDGRPRQAPKRRKGQSAGAEIAALCMRLLPPNLGSAYLACFGRVSRYDASPARSTTSVRSTACPSWLMPLMDSAERHVRGSCGNRRADGPEICVRGDDMTTGAPPTRTAPLSQTPKGGA